MYLFIYLSVFPGQEAMAWDPAELLSGAVHFSYFMLFTSLFTQLPGLHGPQGTLDLRQALSPLLVDMDMHDKGRCAPDCLMLLLLGCALFVDRLPGIDPYHLSRGIQDSRAKGQVWQWSVRDCSLLLAACTLETLHACTVHRHGPHRFEARSIPEAFD